MLNLIVIPRTTEKEHRDFRTQDGSELIIGIRALNQRKLSPVLVSIFLPVEYCRTTSIRERIAPFLGGLILSEKRK